MMDGSIAADGFVVLSLADLSFLEQELRFKMKVFEEERGRICVSARS